MKLGIFGSRSIADDRAEAEISEFLARNKGYDTIVTAQEPKGICSMAQIYAKKNAMKLELHFLDIPRRARGAWWHRSQGIIDAADFVLLIHDGISKGTSNEYEQTRKSKKPHKYIVMDKTTKLENQAQSDIFRNRTALLDDDYILDDLDFKMML